MTQIFENSIYILSLKTVGIQSTTYTLLPLSGFLNPYTFQMLIFQSMVLWKNVHKLTLTTSFKVHETIA